MSSYQTRLFSPRIKICTHKLGVNTVPEWMTVVITSQSRAGVVNRSIGCSRESLVAVMGNEVVRSMETESSCWRALDLEQHRRVWRLMNTLDFWPERTMYDLHTQKGH